MNRFFRKYLLVLFVLAVLFFTGCANLGPIYQKIDKIPDDSGLVYIYRPPGFVGSGVSPNLYTDKGNTFITKIYSGGYFPYLAKPGEIDFSAATETESSVTLDIVTGQVYFIKLTIGIGFFIGRPHLMVIPAETAEKEISECKLILKEKEN